MALACQVAEPKLNVKSYPNGDILLWMDEVRVDGRVLRRLRKTAGLTQGQLALKAKVPQSVISNLELGKKNRARVSTVGKLSVALGIGMEDLLTGQFGHPAVPAPALDLADPELALVLSKFRDLPPEDQWLISQEIDALNERNRRAKQREQEEKRKQG